MDEIVQGSLKLYPDASSASVTRDWPHVTVTNSDFNFEELLKASVERDMHEDALFSLSPLSTPPNTPELSPVTTPTSSTTQLADENIPCLRLSGMDCATPALSSTIPPPPDAAGDHPTPTLSTTASPLPDAPSDGVLTGRQKRKRREKERKHEIRKQQRVEESASVYGGNYQGRPSTRQKYVINAKPINTKFDFGSAKVVSTGYMGWDDGERSKQTYQLNDLVGEGSLGFQYVPWDGVTPTSILANGRLVGILAGKPDGDSWLKMEREAAELLASAEKRCRIPEKKLDHRRGTFKTLRSGVSHGSGQSKPSNAYNNKTNTRILQELNGSDPFKRLAGFASSVMATWAPEMYKYYSDHLGALFQHDPSLKRNFTRSIFPSNTYNLGPRTVCFKHTDFSNLPFGLCAVTALGSFNPTTGGHLVLWQCKLVIEFPPGSTILIPSAVVAHFNIDVGPGEVRSSFTQYAAGGLFRWVDYGFRSRTEHYKSMSQEEQDIQDEENSQRWMFGLDFFPMMKTCESTV